MTTERKLEVKGATCASCGTAFTAEVFDLLPVVTVGTIGRTDAGVDLATGSHDTRRCSSCGQNVERTRMFLFEVTDPVVTHILKRLRDARLVLDELNDDLAREVRANKAVFDTSKSVREAMWANPCEQTARAYIAQYDGENAKARWGREDVIHERRRKVIDVMDELRDRMHDLLGIGRKKFDFERRP